MLLDQLHQQHDQINAACRQYGARRIRVFGSVVHGEEHADSDIDFLVELPRGYNMLTQRIPLQQRLAEITGRKSDLVPEHELNKTMRDRILKEAIDL
ncbi:MAG: nucleotidyltransferase domain-containing protein [Nitrosospira sp.]|nr:nucleotidyltransferase domain-containing protein [Nitrosospira sp.]MDN5935182.1 nucleotidyltransferase domain-containing protein [Nitrosospira sp.]